MSTDNEKLHKTHDALWRTWRELSCGCIVNDFNQRIRYCPMENPRRGTHGGAKS